MTISETNATIAELRDLIHVMDTQKKSGAVSEDTVHKVRKTLVKLRRCHAKLRAAEREEQTEVMKVAKNLESARSLFENAEFVESQCDFLVQKFNSAQCPDLDQVVETLPSVEEYTRLHSGDANFVSQESDPHQFTLNMLSSELEVREQLANEIIVMKKNEELVKNEIGNRQKFLSSLTTRLVDLNKSMESLRKLFSLTELKLPNLDSIINIPSLFLVASKFHSVAAVDPRVSVTINQEVVRVNIEISDLPPSGLIGVSLTFSEPSLLTWDPFCPCLSIHESVLHGLEPAGQLTHSIRDAFVVAAWSKFEQDSLLSPTPHASLISIVSALKLGSIPFDCQLASFKQLGSQFAGKLKIKSSQIEFEINQGSVRLLRLPNSVSSKPEAGQIVDIGLAQAELDIASNVFEGKCPLTRIIVQIMTLV